MLDLKLLRQDPEAVAKALRKKRFEFPVERFRELDAARKKADTDSQRGR